MNRRWLKWNNELIARLIGPAFWRSNEFITPESGFPAVWADASNWEGISTWYHFHRKPAAIGVCRLTGRRSSLKILIEKRSPPKLHPNSSSYSTFDTMKMPQMHWMLCIRVMDRPVLNCPFWSVLERPIWAYASTNVLLSALLWSGEILENFWTRRFVRLSLETCYLDAFQWRSFIQVVYWSSEVWLSRIESFKSNISMAKRCPANGPERSTFETSKEDQVMMTYKVWGGSADSISFKSERQLANE